MEKVPLCVDLDGTLIKTDLLHESLLQLLKINVFYLFLIPFWLVKGKAYIKSQIAGRTTLRYESLPYNSDVLNLIKAARAEGREVVLATASQLNQAEAVAAHLGLFDSIEASDASHNLSSSKKAKRLIDRFGDKKFDYVGNSQADIAVWAHSREALVVSPSKRLIARAKAVCKNARVLPVPGVSLKQIFKAIRIHQWSKNVLVFIPLLVKTEAIQTNEVLNAVLAFIAFGLCASAVYVLNDLLDLESDRQHKSKHRRPFASGAIPVMGGLALVPLLLALTLLVMTFLPYQFSVVLGIYFLTTNLYSFWLKRQVVVDIMLLAILYTSRILAGGAAYATEVSFWLLAFSMFLFLSLGVVKRYTELRDALASKINQPAGRGYSVYDLPLLLSIGVCSGFSAALVLALYVNNPETSIAYTHPQMLWPALLSILYWIIRVWMKTTRGEIHDDPVVFAATDRQSWIVMVIVFICFYTAH